MPREGHEGRVSPRQVHVVGVAGSGKTTLAWHLGARLGAPVHNLDHIYYEGGCAGERPRDQVVADLAAIVAEPAWVTEGSFVDWIDDVLASAELIVWLDVARPVVAWRIIKRHVTRRANPYGGIIPKWIRLVRYLAGRCPESRREQKRVLARYESKVRRITSGSAARIVDLVAGPPRA